MGHLSRFQRPIGPGSGTGTKGLGIKPNTFSSGSVTNQDRWCSTWPLWAAQAGGALVQVGNTNRDQKASTRQQLAGAGGFVFLKGGGFRGFWGVNLGC